MAAVVAAVSVVVVARAPGPDERVAVGAQAPTPTPEATPETTPVPVPTAAAVEDPPPIPGGDDPLPVPDLTDLVLGGRAHDVGDGLVVFWGAFDQFSGAERYRGAVLDTETGELNALEVPPQAGLDDRAVAAGNGELLICCANGVAKLWSAAEGWRTVEAPFGGPGQGVWTHTDYVVMTPGSTPAFFDPTRDDWSVVDIDKPGEVSVERLEMAWTSRPGNPAGEALYVWPAPAARTSHDGWALDPGLNPRWRELSQIPLDGPAVVSFLAADGYLIVGGGLPAATAGASERFVLWLLPPASGRWVRVDVPAGEPDPCECNLGSQTMLWTGSELLVHLGALGSGIDRDGVLYSVTDLAEGGSATLVARGADALRPLTMVGDEVLWARADGAIVLGDEVLVD